MDLIERIFQREGSLYIANEAATKVLPWYFVVVGIPMGINCAPFVADLFLFCYETDFMRLHVVSFRG